VIVRLPVEKTCVVVTGPERIVCAVYETQVGVTLHRAGELARIVMGALVRRGHLRHDPGRELSRQWRPASPNDAQAQSMGQIEGASSRVRSL